MKTTIKTKRCTMNCGPAIGDTRTQAERQNACGDCIEVDAPARANILPRVALSDEQIRSILMAHGFKIHEGMTDLKPYVYESARAILSAQADVSDINVGDMPENDAGIGVTHKPGALKAAMPSKLRALSRHMEDIAVEMDYFGGFAPWARCGGELMGAAMMVAEWAEACTASKEPQ